MKKTITGICLLALSIFMLLGFLNADINAGIWVKFLSFVITVILPFSGGAAILFSNYKDKKKLTLSKSLLAKKTLESEVLKLAKEKGGSLTAIEVVTEFAVDIDTAKQTLDSLAEQSVAEIELTESGIIVYSFYDIKHLKDKSTSKGVLDA